jgi:hypothetical protein
VEASTGVALNRVSCEILQLGERLEASVATADENVAEELVATAWVIGGVGFLECLDQVISEPDCIGKALEANRVLR